MQMLFLNLNQQSGQSAVLQAYGITEMFSHPTTLEDFWPSLCVHPDQENAFSLSLIMRSSHEGRLSVMSPCSKISLRVNQRGKRIFILALKGEKK